MNEEIRKRQLERLCQLNLIMSEFTINYIYQSYNDSEFIKTINYNELLEMKEKISKWNKELGVQFEVIENFHKKVTSFSSPAALLTGN